MRTIWGVLGLALLLPGTALAADLRSEYTDLDFTQCTLIESDDTGAMSACPGLRGFPVLVGDGDLRMFVSYGATASAEPAMTETLPPFNHVGTKIEWLVDATDKDHPQPRATILRFITAGENGDDKGQVLVVTQIKPRATCQIALVDALAVKDANAVARKLAATAGSYDCTKEPERIQPFTAY